MNGINKKTQVLSTTILCLPLYIGTVDAGLGNRVNNILQPNQLTNVPTHNINTPIAHLNTRPNIQLPGVEPCGGRSGWKITGLQADMDSDEGLSTINYDAAFATSLQDDNRNIYLGIQGEGVDVNNQPLFYTKLAGKGTLPKEALRQVAVNLAESLYNGENVSLKDIAYWADSQLTLNTVNRFSSCLDSEHAKMNSLVPTNTENLTFDAELKQIKLNWHEEGNSDLNDNDIEFMLPDGGFIDLTTRGKVMTEFSQFLLAKGISPDDYTGAAKRAVEFMTNPENFEDELQTTILMISDYTARHSMYLTPRDGRLPEYSDQPSENSQEAFFYYINVQILQKNHLTKDGAIVIAASLDGSLIRVIDWKLQWGLFPALWQE